MSDFIDKLEKMTQKLNDYNNGKFCPKQTAIVILSGKNALMYEVFKLLSEDKFKERDFDEAVFVRGLLEMSGEVGENALISLIMKILKEGGG